MRIDIVTETWPPEINGVALTVAGLAHGLAELGHVVRTVRPRQRGDDNGGGALGDAALLVRGMRLPRYPELQFGLPAGRRLHDAWRRDRPDVVYVATEGPLGWSALRCARRLGIPAATGFHTRFDAFVRHYGLGALAPLAFAWLRRFHRRGDATIVPTGELAEFLGANDFGNVVRVPRAVDTRLFAPHRRDPALRASWGLAPRQLAVVHVGRIAAEKNLPLAVRAFRVIQQVAPDARFIWIGDGPARAALAAANPAFVFVGIQRGATLAAHLASTDLFVFPSLTETFGNVTLEALASGVPTVAFDYGAAREHLDPAAGRAVPFGDADAFVEAALSVARDPPGLPAARAAARACVERLDPHSVTRQFAQALATLAAASAVSGTRNAHGVAPTAQRGGDPLGGAP